MSDQSKPRKRSYVKPGFKKVKLDATVLLSKGCKSAEHHGGHGPIPMQPGGRSDDMLRFGQQCKQHGFFVRIHEQGS